MTLYCKLLILANAEMLLRALCQHAAKHSMSTIAIQHVRLLTPCRSVPRISSFRTFAVGPEMPGVELKVMDKLKEKQHAISTVESCTGGRIADLLTNVGGAAQVYWGSVVTYDGSLKSDWGVPAGSIKDIGTVTEQARHSLGVPQALESHVIVPGCLWSSFMPNVAVLPVFLQRCMPRYTAS